MDARGPLAGIRVVEVSSFVASPLCGLTLAQLGASVVRVDPIGGAADSGRLPRADSSGDSIYWTGLNKGKRSIVEDLRNAEGQKRVQDLIVDSGSEGGIVVTNLAGREWLGYDTLAEKKDDVIVVEICGARDGAPAVDYTVNAGLGFPSITGPAGSDGVVNHVLPAWDVACGLYAAVAVVSAVRDRELTGRGAHIKIPLEDVALSVASTLGYLTEPQVNGRGREGVGNDVYGTYGKDFATGDGGRIMVVVLTNRHFTDLVNLTGVGEAVSAVGHALGADFTLESDRFAHRAVLHALVEPWFRSHSLTDVERLLADTSVLSKRYQSFDELVASGSLQENPLFDELVQPGIGTFLAAASPVTFNGKHLRTGPAEKLGASSGGEFDWG
ncbi:CoA transferase [Dietzia maris]|uniref:CoA transferase n=1 Tax=Dietzia maris TaxID=37915 RepID=UPI0037C68A67